MIKKDDVATALRLLSNLSVQEYISISSYLPFHFLIFLQLRKQNREMEQTLEIVDEENAKIRREMERTNTQLSTFATWVEKRELL